MQLSREALTSLETFHLEPFSNEESLQNAVRRVYDQLLKTNLNGIIYPFIYCLAFQPKEKKPWEYGLSVLILQAAKRGFSRSELAFELSFVMIVSDYTRQLGWVDDKISPVCDMYEANLTEFRERMDNTGRGVMKCVIVVSSLPKLIGMKCSLLSRELLSNQRNCRIDFTNAITYYRVLLIVLGNALISLLDKGY